MSYKSIMTAVASDARAKAILPLATEIARREEAHLDVLTLGLDRLQSAHYYGGVSAMVMQEGLDRAASALDSLEELVTAEMDKTDIRWSQERALLPLGDLARGFAARAIFSDLVILPRPYDAGNQPEDEALVEGALFDGRVPVLILPESPATEGWPERIIIGWDESLEAMAAVRAALPFISRAKAVHVVLVDPPAHSASRTDPGGRLSQFLSRHGARVEIDVLAKSMPRVSDVLQRHAGDINADLLVMGAYGHSRLREAILGGATRNMLAETKFPLLMAR